MHDIEILSKLISNLDAIEVNSSLDNNSLNNAICSTFLNSGNNLLYIFSNEKTGWLYFKNKVLIAAYTHELAGIDAVSTIVQWEDVSVKEYRGVDILEQHFSYEIHDFLQHTSTLVQEENPHHEFLGIDHFIDSTDGIQGILCYENGIYQHINNLDPSDTPVEYLQSLCDYDSRGKGVMIKLEINDEIKQLYAINYDDQLWVINLKEKKAYLKAYENISKRLKEVLDAN